ncbi:MAG: peptidoglycan DD-metalloendopeptidase family protein [Acutalibacteraceae bacterium]|nr:peptidoglycan DD-metalloendopeptidase family protein [Acutalibacteraceae bacterium]
MKILQIVTFLKAVNIIFTDLDPQQLIEKINNNKYVKKIVDFVKSNKIVVKITSVAVVGVSIVAIATASAGIRLGFDVKYSGRVIGTVGSRSVCVDARKIAVENVSSENADGAVCTPKLTLTLTVKNNLDDADKVATAIIENSDDVVSASALIVNGETVACVQASGLDKLLDARRMSYYVEGAENEAQFVDNVSFETGYYLREDLTDIISLEAIVDALQVKTVSKYNTDVSIPYGTTKIKTDTKPMGYYEVTTAGKKGINRKSLVVESINGEETSRQEISAQVISEPVNRVITIGTAVVKVSSSEKANVSSSGFICPLERGKFVVSAYYGDGRNHKAIDLAANRGVAIFAAAGGTVTYAGYDGDYGYNVVIDHGNGIKTRYAHASYLTVSKGQVVSQGDMIAAVGSTGYSTGNHLHFEVIVNGTRVNPAPYIGL